MRHTSWLVQRAVLAIVLMVGFYVLSLATIAGLLWIPYAEYVYFDRVHIRIAFACVVGAIALGLSLMPRKDHFEPPGPLLEEASEPRLFAFIREIATATRQPMPEEIYLIGDVNAWVAQRGGTMGFGSRRIIGIGLPLLNALPLAEVRSVVAHEFGHFASSDVALGPWIYTTRAAIGRTVASLQQSILGKPFVWYGHLFMRLTQAISRQQEFVADQMSASIVGADVAAQALRRISTAAPAYLLYAQREVMPVLRAGFIPPIGHGFQQFLQTDRYRLLCEQLHERGDTPADPYDTHPPMRDRLAALGASGEITHQPAVAESGLALLSDPERLSRRVMGKAFGVDALHLLKPIGWEQVGEAVHAQTWRAFTTAHASILAPLTMETLPVGRVSFLDLVATVKIRGGAEKDQRLSFAISLVGAALATALRDRNWKANGAPGESVTLTREGVSIKPFAVIEALARGQMTDAEWAMRRVQAGLTGPLLSESIRPAFGITPAASAAPEKPAPSPVSRRPVLVAATASRSPEGFVPRRSAQPVR